MNAIEILKAASELNRAARHLTAQFSRYAPELEQQANIDARQILMHAHWNVLNQRWEQA